jgi:hypothetical protein
MNMEYVARESIFKKRAAPGALIRRGGSGSPGGAAR